MSDIAAILRMVEAKAPLFMRAGDIGYIRCKANRRPANTAEHTRMRELYVRKFPRARIAKLVGVSVRTVYNHTRDL
jgi:hypothetical protein